MRYYQNGKPVTSTQAKAYTKQAYLSQGGWGDDFELVWDLRDQEEARETLNEWSGYVIEFITDEEDEALDD